MDRSETAVLQLGVVAPDFQADTTQGKISFHEWLGDAWCVFFSHPKDFTPVCTTELGMAAQLSGEFERRGVKLIGLSVGSVADHHRWTSDINQVGHTSLKFPIIGDCDHHISHLYGMIHPLASDTATVRTVFIIDNKKKVRLTMTYPASTGRNFNEILRVVDALQLTDKYKVSTPVNWVRGQECVIPTSITDPKEISTLYPKGFRTITPYLRMTPDPSTH